MIKETIQKFMDNIASVKVWIIILATILVFANKLEGAQWLYVALGIIGGRVGEYIWHKG